MSEREFLRMLILAKQKLRVPSKHDAFPFMSETELCETLARGEMIMEREIVLENTLKLDDYNDLTMTRNIVHRSADAAIVFGHNTKNIFCYNDVRVMDVVDCGK